MPDVLAGSPRQWTASTLTYVAHGLLEQRPPLEGERERQRNSDSLVAAIMGECHPHPPLALSPKEAFAVRILRTVRRTPWPGLIRGVIHPSAAF